MTVDYKERKSLPMKKLLSVLLATMLLLSLCSFAAAEEPVNVLFWHSRGSGAQLETVTYQVDTFNETIGKEKGIFIEAIYIGNYATLQTKCQLASQTGEQPVLTLSGPVRVASLMDDDLLVDMLPYAQRDNYDLSNFLGAMYNNPFCTEEMCYSFPYIKSTPVLYYNKTMADAKGLKAPTTYSEYEDFCRALHTVDETTGEVLVWGTERLSDFMFYEGCFLMTMGTYLWDETGTKSPAISSGNMEKVISDWRRAVDEGWCRPFDAASASAALQERFYQGKVACFMSSCGNMGNIQKYATEAGIELGVTYMPCMDGYEDNFSVPVGGGQICVMKGNTEEQINGAWEFLKFLFTDDMVAYNAIHSGYLPTTKSVGEDETMTAFWAENPNYKVAYDQVQYGFDQANPRFDNNSEFSTNLNSTMSLLIQEQSITVAEAMEQIKADNAHLFPDGF